MKKFVSRLKRRSSVYRHQPSESELESEPLHDSKFVGSLEPACLFEEQDGPEPALGSRLESERVWPTSTVTPRKVIAQGGRDLSPATVTADPAEQTGIQHVDAAPSLEGLPFEIQRCILSAIPDLPALRALIHASPRLHSVYTQDRLNILKECVDRSIGNDAHAAYLTGTESFRRSEITMPMILDFLMGYKKVKASGSPPPTIANAVVRPEDYMQLARFHLSVVEPLTERYALWAMAALGSSQVTHPLSETERRRIQRAMYRLETFCNVCSERSPCQIYDTMDRLMILSTFHAWEVEEMLCFHGFVRERVDSVFHQVALQLQSAKPFGRSLVDDRGAINGDFRNKVLLCGLTPLMVFFKTADTDELAGAVRRYLDEAYLYSNPYDHWLDAPNGILTHLLDLRCMHPDNYLSLSMSLKFYFAQHTEWGMGADVGQDSRDELRFEGDTTDSPSLAWVLYWNAIITGSFRAFDFGPAPFRRWGYVMWDAHRLDNGARAYLERKSQG